MTAGCGWHGCTAAAMNRVRADVPHKLTTFTTFYWLRCAPHTPREVAGQTYVTPLSGAR